MKKEQEVTTTETVEQKNESQAETLEEVKKEKTYTRDEVERIKAYERELIRKEIQKEAEAKKQEAEKLAKMDEDQKKSYEFDKVSKERDSAVSELNAYKLKDEAIKQANEKGIDLELMETLDYKKETAESIKNKIEIFEKTYKKVHEKAISEYSKEPTPQVGDKISEKSISECKSYEDFNNYYKKHPNGN